MHATCEGDSRAEARGNPNAHVGSVVLLLMLLAIVFRHVGPPVYRHPVDFALYRYDDDIIASPMVNGWI